ncbi:uncharacterized protein SCODWIG_02235 [Saccharomycodes ludwigii]|uniref:dolichol kinase n=1 Tax=Saccharomycodes ludwigii TaxID=36035 RepID=A0A376B7K9_9ASCO|nr:uncharacterized protein SCODWIG_02235 [Saccharomycodes ludwigii]
MSDPNLQSTVTPTQFIKTWRLIFNDLSSPNKLVQLLILMATTHILFLSDYTKNKLSTVDITTIIVTFVTFIAAYMYSLRKQSNQISNYKNYNEGYYYYHLTNHKNGVFDVFYLIFLPLSFSLLYSSDTTTSKMLILNCCLLFNYLRIPVFTKIPLQSIFGYLILSSYYSNHDVAVPELSHLFIVYCCIINYMICWILVKVSQLKSFTLIECNLFSILLTNVLFIVDFSSTSLPFQILQKSLIALFIIMLANFIIDPLFTKPQSMTRSGLLLSNILVGFPILINYLLTPIFHSSNYTPIIWLYNYIMQSPTRLVILCVWLSCLLILIPNIVIFCQNGVSLNTSRKVWHFLILLLISIPFKYDPDFVKISLAGTIPLFLIVEYIRFLQIWPIGSMLDMKLRSFADFRDNQGPIIISYIYLIIGCALPLLIDNQLWGVISLGVGDSFASIIGGRYGKIFWYGTKKTFEGTLAFILLTFVTSIVLFIFYTSTQNNRDIGLTWDLASRYLLNCFVSGILEANSDMNDNILVPAFMLVLSKLMHI